jgi:DNA-binding XRE family transcriptional regulator
MINLGIPIKKYRIAKRLSQVDLAKIIEVTPTYISALENNRKEPSIALISKISEELDIPKEVLFWEAVSSSIEVKQEDKEILEVANSIINEYYNQKT